MLLKRYADYGITIFASNDTSSIVKEISNLMLFCPNNLIINVKLNGVCCQYLDLFLSFDDITAARDKIHYRTYFKKFHKFAYVDPKCNHPGHVFRGLVRTECIRYIQNSSCISDYNHSVRLFKIRLQKLRYTNCFLRKNVLHNPRSWVKRKLERVNFNNKIFYSMEYDRKNNMVGNIQSLFSFAACGLGLKQTIFVSKGVSPKLQNVLSTRRILHDKLKHFSFD